MTETTHHSGPALTPLLRTVVGAALDKKADDLLVLDPRGKADYCDRFVICSADNIRQLRAIAGAVVDSVRREHGLRPLGVEGLDSERWVLVDLGDVILHVFNHMARDYYDLEGLWVDAQRVSYEALGLDEEGRPLPGTQADPPEEAISASAS